MLKDAANRPWPLLQHPWIAELKVRTDVQSSGCHGVWLFCLGVACQLAVWAARRGYSLPYYRAQIVVEHDGERVYYRSVRRQRNSNNSDRPSSSDPPRVKTKTPGETKRTPVARLASGPAAHGDQAGAGLCFAPGGGPLVGSEVVRHGLPAQVHLIRLSSRLMASRSNASGLKLPPTHSSISSCSGWCAS